MNALEQISKSDWIKNWSGNWQMPFASLYFAYTKGLRWYVGKNLSTNLIICEPNVSSNFIDKKVLNTYGKFITNTIMRNPKLAETWARDTVNTADALFVTLGIFQNTKNLNLENLLRLKKEFYVHIPPHFSMKKVVDFLPEKLRQKVTPRLVQARIKTEHLFNAVDKVLNKYASLVSKKTGLPKKLTKFLTIEEIEIFLRTNRLPPKLILEKRSNGSAIFYKGAAFEIIIGTEYIELQKSLVKFSGTELKGTVAYAGKAIGVVKIVLDPRKVKTFKKGTILITGMTRPEFLPLMKKAGAFVTDAGGILSHAAIVARELKKPCILGTEVATKVFKDGDIVEVDATKGVVRLIKRNKEK